MTRDAWLALLLVAIVVLFVWAALGFIPPPDGVVGR